MTHRRSALMMALSSIAGSALLPSISSAQPPHNLPKRRATDAVDVEERSLFDLQADMSAGRTTSIDLVNQYTRRIARLDRSGPRLASLIELNPDALQIARPSSS